MTVWVSRMSETDADLDDRNDIVFVHEDPDDGTALETVSKRPAVKPMQFDDNRQRQPHAEFL